MRTQEGEKRNKRRTALFGMTLLGEIKRQRLKDRGRERVMRAGQGEWVRGPGHRARAVVPLSIPQTPLTLWDSLPRSPYAGPGVTKTKHSKLKLSTSKEDLPSSVLLRDRPCGTGAFRGERWNRERVPKRLQTPQNKPMRASCRAFPGLERLYP